MTEQPLASVELIVHCWSGKYRHYAACLNYQLSALLIYPARTQVTMTVCHTVDDREVNEVIMWFARRGTNVSSMPLSIEQLGRRSIGRNTAAKLSEADIVFFTDVDHLFRTGCLDALGSLTWPDGASIVYPRNLMIHHDHATGDRLTGAWLGPCLADIDESEFIAKKYLRPIGPAQIIRGDFAREHGYLDGDPYWQQPRTDGRPFGDFRDDVAFRKFCLQHGRMVGIDLPGIFRIRHSRTTYQGPQEP